MLEEGGFKIGAEVSVAVGPWGRKLNASTNLGFHQGILSYSHSKGLYIGAVLTGAEIVPDAKANSKVYGKGKEFSATDLLSGKVNASGVPASVSRFSHLLSMLSSDVSGDDDSDDGDGGQVGKTFSAISNSPDDAALDVKLSGN